MQQHNSQRGNSTRATKADKDWKSRLNQYRPPSQKLPKNTIKTECQTRLSSSRPPHIARNRPVKRITGQPIDIVRQLVWNANHVDEKEIDLHSAPTPNQGKLGSDVLEFGSPGDYP